MDGNAFSKIGAWVARKRQQRRLLKEKESAIWKATDAVADVTDPRIRQVRGYREKLGPAVEEAMRFADELVDGLPGPIEVGRQQWATDPYVKAFFAGVDEIQQVLRLDRELGAFFKGHPFTECYALLTMKRREQTVFRTEQFGEMVRRDVAQTAVNFLGHRVVDPCRTEEETRTRLKARTLSVLSEYASEKIASLSREREELRAQKDVMKTKLKVLQEEFHDAHSPGNGRDVREGNKVGEARDLLKEIERRIEQANLVIEDPRDCLAHVAGVLSHPLDHMKRETLTLRLNPMGIKVCRDFEETCGEIVLTEIELIKGVKRVVVVIKLKRTEVLGP